MRWQRLTLATFLLTACPWVLPARALSPPPQPEPPQAAVVDMETMVVSGVQPGPGLWRVSQGEHVLYILGTQSPLPKDITWRSKEVTGILEQAGVVLGPPGLWIDTDLGFFRRMWLAPAAMKAAKNPDGATLQEILPSADYARWSALKQHYLGRDAGIEKKRPLIAGFQLYQRAVSRSGMKSSGVIEPVIDGVLKRRGLQRTSTLLKITLTDPRAAITEFSKQPMSAQDLQCFRKTLDRIESDMPRVAERANAWAVGDWEVMRSGVAEQQQLVCMTAWLETDLARKRGLSDIDTRVRKHWMDHAVRALEQHAVSLAMVPVDDLLKPNGYLALLQARGYQVEAP